MPSKPSKVSDAMRIDSWLWTSRLFKTRSLAAEAVGMGRVEINGQRVKPAKPVRAGDRVSVRRPPHTQEFIVLDLAPRRVSATLARSLYEETAASSARRLELDENLRLGAVADHRRYGKLNKKERRERERFKRDIGQGD